MISTLRPFHDSRMSHNSKNIFDPMITTLYRLLILMCYHHMLLFCLSNALGNVTGLYAVIC